MIHGGRNEKLKIVNCEKLRRFSIENFLVIKRKSRGWKILMNEVFLKSERDLKLLIKIYFYKQQPQKNCECKTFFQFTWVFFLLVFLSCCCCLLRSLLRAVESYIQIKNLPFALSTLFSWQWARGLWCMCFGIDDVWCCHGFKPRVRHFDYTI